MKKLLLHSCCGPCSTQVIDVLRKEYDITIYYYNPNIDTEEEYLHRLAEQKRFCAEVGVEVIEDGYNPHEFLSRVVGLEKEPEGGARCSVCFRVRLEKTAAKAQWMGFDLFGTTLTVSPHKNAEVINAIGLSVAKKIGVAFLEGNYKKQDGYKKSIEFSKKYNLYRQNYCGCIFAKGDNTSK
ncbi:MAG: epoxyqueuosine reductase QueH [Clostridia bacterium]|nr:epoxyqueuosine reductase QueH [Clostridia bacterium]